MPRSRNAVARSSEYGQTPPTASAVISTRRMPCRGAARNSVVSVPPAGVDPTLPFFANIIQLELAEPKRPRVLNVAEAIEAPEIVVHGAFPRAIVSSAPPPGVFRRSGVREHRHRLIGPDSELLDL